MNRLFYILYNSYYKHGTDSKGNPIMTVYFIVIVLLFCLCLLFDNIIVMLQDPYAKKTRISGSGTYVLGALLGVIVYFALIYKGRYHMIYNKYKDDPFVNSKGGRILGWFLITAIILSPFISALLKNKYFLGSWI